MSAHNYTTCEKCGIRRNLDETEDCPICRVPQKINLEEIEINESVKKAVERMEKKTIEASTRTTRTVDEIQSLSETRNALAVNVKELWKKIDSLEAHVKYLLSLKMAIKREIKKEVDVI